MLKVLEITRICYYFFTQGVRLINLKENDSIAAVAKVVLDEDEVQDIDDIEVVDDNQIN